MSGIILDFIKAYERLSTAALTLQKDIQLSCDQPGFSFDETLHIAMEGYRQYTMDVFSAVQKLESSVQIGTHKASCLASSIRLRKQLARGVEEGSTSSTLAVPTGVRSKTGVTRGRQQRNMAVSRRKHKKDQVVLARTAEAMEHKAAALQSDSARQTALRRDAMNPNRIDAQDGTMAHVTEVQDMAALPAHVTEVEGIPAAPHMGSAWAQPR